MKKFEICFWVNKCIFGTPSTYFRFLQLLLAWFERRASAKRVKLKGNTVNRLNISIGFIVIDR